jgi:hypothetical protein
MGNSPSGSCAYIYALLAVHACLAASAQVDYSTRRQHSDSNRARKVRSAAVATFWGAHAYESSIWPMTRPPASLSVSVPIDCLVFR